MLRNCRFFESWFIFQEPLPKIALYLPSRNMAIAFFRYFFIQISPAARLFFLLEHLYLTLLSC